MQKPIEIPPTITEYNNLKEFNHYYIDVRGLDFIDIYRITDAYNLPSALHHAVKKLLCAGVRGAKNSRQDLLEAKKSIDRQLEMLDEDSKRIILPQQE